ncbi:MAG: hypothetical protein WBM54_12785, partial [Woeseia sp.]
AWVFGIDKALAEAHIGAQLRIPRIFRFIIKYVSPTYLLIIFIGFCWNRVPDYVRSVLTAASDGNPDDRVALYSWGVILGTIALLVSVTAIGARRWRAAGIDIDGKYPPDDERVSNPVSGSTS